MQLSAIINTILPPLDENAEYDAYYDLRELSFKSKIKIDDAIANPIQKLLQKIKNNEIIALEELANFKKAMDALFSKNQHLCQIISNVFYTVAEEIFSKYKKEYEKAVKDIEKNNYSTAPNPELKKYIGLLNIYILFSEYFDPKFRTTGNYFPGISNPTLSIIAETIPCAINAFILTGKIPATTYIELDTSKALYPKFQSKSEKVPVTRGIKNSDQYFTYKPVFKLATGDTGDNTYLATNKNKKFFLRIQSMGSYSPESIFASKIATFVNKQYFSSERLFSNKIAASRKLESYQISVADDKTRKTRKNYIEIEKKIFPNTGMIDEVCNFIDEGDPNIENFGFSNTNIEQSSLSKIDFDYCNFYNLSKKDYEKDIITRNGRHIHHGKNYPQTQKNPIYLKEKLSTRLKLALLNKEFLDQLAKKAYIDDQKRAEAVQECVKRSDLALELFLEHPAADKFLQDHPNSLEKANNEIIEYIKRHFDDSLHNLLMKELTDRFSKVSKEIATKFPAINKTEKEPEQLMEDEPTANRLPQFKPLTAKPLFAASNLKKTATSPKLIQHRPSNKLAIVGLLTAMILLILSIMAIICNSFILAGALGFGSLAAATPSVLSILRPGNH